MDSLGGKLTINDKIPYSDLYRKLVKNRAYFNFSIIQPLFSDKIYSKQVVEMLDDAKNQPGPISISFQLLGGEVSKVSSKATAFYPRKKQFFVDIASFWQNITESQSMESWTNTIVSTLLDVKDTYAYVGFPITFSNIKYSNKVYYGKNYKRLQKIKAYYDPLNILTQCGTITP